MACPAIDLVSLAGIRSRFVINQDCQFRSWNLGCAVPKNDCLLERVTKMVCAASLQKCFLKNRASTKTVSRYCALLLVLVLACTCAFAQTGDKKQSNSQNKKS